MWGKAFLVITGLASFFYFLFPDLFSMKSVQDKDVLGVKKINAQINRSNVETSLTAYCIDKGNLPASLNELYTGYLDDRVKVDLSELFEYKITDPEDCKYTLQPK